MGEKIRIFPVMVIYKTQLRVTEVYRTLLKGDDFDAFMIYDNSPASFSFDDSELPAGVVYVRDLNNGGVSKAYNVGAQYALEHGYTHILLLDQDTSFPYDTAALYKSQSEWQGIAVPLLQMKNGRPFSPCQRNGLRTKAVSLSPGRFQLQHYAPVNSGMCIPLSVFFEAGAYNERVKLDFADFEFISRCRKVCQTLIILPILAIQDFSNEENDADKLFARYVLYLESAKATHWELFKDRLMLHLEVLLHTLALTKRTGAILFLKQYFKFLLNKKL